MTTDQTDILCDTAVIAPLEGGNSVVVRVIVTHADGPGVYTIPALLYSDLLEAVTEIVQRQVVSDAQAGA